MTAPNPWCTVNDLPDDCRLGVDGAGTGTPDDDMIGDAIAAASDVMWALTNYAYTGTRTDIIRPVSPSCGCWMPLGMFGGSALTGPPVDLFSSSAFLDAWPFGVTYGDRWWPWGRFGCVPTPGVELASPVVSVEEVLLSGEVVDPSRYKVLDHHLLVRTDQDLWPCCQDLRNADDAEGSLRISYTWGKPIPAGGRRCAGVLACAYASDWSANIDGVRFPHSTTAVTREGISFAILDPGTAIAEGRTGIPSVDLWVGSINQPRHRGSVSSVSTWQQRRSRRVTWPTSP